MWKSVQVFHNALIFALTCITPYNILVRIICVNKFTSIAEWIDCLIDYAIFH